MCINFAASNTDTKDMKIGTTEKYNQDVSIDEQKRKMG